MSGMRAQVLIPVIVSILILGTIDEIQNIFAHPTPENICRDTSDPSISVYSVRCTDNPEPEQSVLFIQKGMPIHHTVVAVDVFNSQVTFDACGHLPDGTEIPVCFTVQYYYEIVGN